MTNYGELSELDASCPDLWRVVRFLWRVVQMRVVRMRLVRIPTDSCSRIGRPMTIREKTVKKRPSSRLKCHTTSYSAKLFIPVARPIRYKENEIISIILNKTVQRLCLSQ